MASSSKISRIGGVIAAIVLMLLVVMAIGTGYEQVQRRRDRERLPQVGQYVEIGGRRLNVYCSGEGTPAVILESDALEPGFSWWYVQKEIAKTTRTCWYDRAGYGWSDPAPPPRSSLSSARDLHELLQAAGIAAPSVFVGDGFGSMNLRVYNGLYPQDVAGMVFVDPIAEEEERMGMASRIPFHLGYPSGTILTAVQRIGLMRLMARQNRQRPTPQGFTPEERAILSGLERLPSMKAALLAEEGFSRSMEEVRAAPDLGDRPLLILRSQSADLLPDGSAVPSKLSALSTRERQIAVPGTDRNILYEAPSAVVGSVGELLRELRQGVR